MRAGVFGMERGDYPDDLCGDCFRAGTLDPADHLTNDLDTRIAEVQPEPVEVRGAWESANWDGVEW